MRVKILYDQGSASIPEDQIIFCPPDYYGAVDGTTGVYLPSEGPTLFDGKTGGQLASRVLAQSFGSTSSLTNVEAILRQANDSLCEIIQNQGLALWDSAFLPSVAFVVASLGRKEIDIIQAGDCLAVWQMKDGTTGGTPNKVFNYERELLSIIAGLIEF